QESLSDKANSSGNKAKLFVNGVINFALSLLMRTFTGHAVANPGHHEIVFWIGESTRGLRAAVAESIGRRMASVAVWSFIRIVIVGVQNKTESPIEFRQKSIIEESSPLPGCEKLERLFPEKLFSSGPSAGQQHFVKPAQLFDGSSRAASRATDRHARLVLQWNWLQLPLLSVVRNRDAIPVLL